MFVDLINFSFFTKQRKPFYKSKKEDSAEVPAPKEPLGERSQEAPCYVRQLHSTLADLDLGIYQIPERCLTTRLKVNAKLLVLILSISFSIIFCIKFDKLAEKLV